MAPFTDKINALAARLIAAAPGGRLAVAFSGGLDSRFLIHMALREGYRVNALHVNGPHIPSHEHAYARAWAEKARVPLTVISLDPLTMPALRDNPRDRCYHCKKTVFTAIRDAAGGLPLCDGTNASDAGEYRPGLKAVAELGILSPLAEAGLCKKDIRHIGAATDLGNPDQAAQPCLLTRFGYGTRLHGGLLRAVDAAEQAVMTVFARHGLENAPFRLRYETPEKPALHLGFSAIPPALLENMGKTLADCGYPGIPVRHMETLSGYFDK